MANATNRIPKGTKVVISETASYHEFTMGELCTVSDTPAFINDRKMYALKSETTGKIQAVQDGHFKIAILTRAQPQMRVMPEQDEAQELDPRLRDALLQRLSGTTPPQQVPNPFETLPENYFDEETEKPALVSKAKKIVQPKKLTIDGVILSDEKHEEIKAALAQLKYSKLIFEDWGFGEVFEKGTAVTMLFYGLPGTGKTLMAQAIAEENNCELKIYGMAEIGSSEPGGSERIIQKIFAEAKEFFTQQRRHRVILFDECDSLLFDRANVGVILGAQINALLSEIERHEGVVVFTTNRVGTLDPALERRITAKIEFPFPDEKQRQLIWKGLIPERAPIHSRVSFKKLAEVPIAGGNIKNAVLNAVRMAAYQETGKIEMKHFLKAIEREMNAIAAFENAKDHRRHIPSDLTAGQSIGRTTDIVEGKDMNMVRDQIIRREEVTHAHKTS